MGVALGVVDGSCVAHADIDFVAPNLAAVDAAIAAAGGAWGLYDAGRRRAYFGPVERAALAFGATALFIGHETWIRTAPGEARQLSAYQSPAGRSLWMEGNSAQVVPCGPGPAP